MSGKDQKLNLSEHVETLFEGVEGVTDEHKAKMEIVLEAAVTSIVATEKQSIQEAANVTIAEQVEEKAVAMESTVSKYLDYVIAEWMTENQIAIETGLKVELAESFFTGMKALFVEHNVEVPEGKQDLVATHESTIAELESKLNESTAKTIDLSEQLAEVAKVRIVSEAAGGLTDTQKEKFASLVEGIEFGTADKFKTKVQTIRESYFKQGAADPIVESKQHLTEERSDDPVEQRRAMLRNPYAFKA